MSLTIQSPPTAGADVEVRCVDPVRALLGEKQPSLRMSLPEDIAATAVWLCRREAHNITGTTVPIDGGWTAQ